MTLFEKCKIFIFRDEISIFGLFVVKIQEIWVLETINNNVFKYFLNKKHNKNNEKH